MKRVEYLINFIDELIKNDQIELELKEEKEEDKFNTDFKIRFFEFLSEFGIPLDSKGKENWTVV